MRTLDSKLLDEALTLLAELTTDHPPQHWVVCGGSSLLALGLVSRQKTRDVDVLARVELEGLVTAKPLPDWLTKAVEAVRGQLGLMDHWFNEAPSDELYFRFGFPDGLAERLTPRAYGTEGNLCISFISRHDQIFFKLHAFADSGMGRHYEDLVDLHPTEAELVAAAQWIRTLDPSEGFLLLLRDAFKELGHESLVAQL